MKRNIVFCVSLTFCLTLQALTDGSWSFTVANGEATLTGYSGTGPENFELPSSVESGGTNYPVVAVGSSAFSGKSWLKTLRMPDTIRSIGNSAFENCRALNSIEVPGSVTNIGSYAFNSCTDLATATLNEGIVSIGDSAFYNCSSLLVASVPNSVTNLGSGAYAYCYALTNITLRGGWNPTQSGRFPSGAGNLDTIEIIGNGDLVIGEKTFGDSYNSSALIKERHLKISGVKSIANGHAFGYSPNLETVEFIGNALENIGNNSFDNCRALRSIEVPGSVTNIGRYAFNGCTNLVTATLNEGIVSIGDYAFCNCSSLLVASVPNSVTNLGSSAYASCNALTNITIRGGWNPTQSGRFPSGAGNLDTIEIIGNGDLVIGEKTFGDSYNSSALIKERHLKISGVKSIANGHAFGYSPNLETVEFIGNALENIGNNSFDNCRALRSIEVPGSVTNIGRYAFNDCTNLVTATLNEGIVSIGDYAFCDCSSLLVASVPNSVTNLGGSAYAYCNALTNITIRGGWNPTQSGRFPSGAGNLDTIEIIGNGDLVIGNRTFGDHYNSYSILKERHLKISGVKSIANEYAFGWSPNLETVEFGGNALENIGNSSFNNCPALKSIEVPGSVTNIGSYAFYGCTNLATAVLMPTNAPMLGGSAFGNTKPATVFVSEDAAGYDVEPWSNWNIRKTNADGSIGMSGSLTANATIDAYTPYAIMAPLTVKSGVKLTIESGARVKFYEWSSITVERGGEVAVKGTIDSPISLVPSGDGVEWNGFTVNWGGRLQLEYVNIEGAGSQAKGAVKSDGYASLWGCCISGSDGIALDGGSVYATNTVIKSMGTAVANSAKLVNGVIEDCDVVNTSGYIYNTIIKDCRAVTSGNFYYCLFDNTDYANFNQYANTSIAGDAKFIDGTFYRIAADSPAVDAGSGRYAPETDYFGSVRMASTNVVAVGEPNGRGICPDIGIHEVEGRTEVNLPDLAVEEIALPAPLSPGAEVEFSYVVTNRGDGVALAPWTEQLWLTNETGCVRLRSWRAMEGISTNSAAVRALTVTIPDTIDLSGSVRALVRIDTDREVIQKNECSHEALSDEATLNGKLTISIGESVREGGSIWGQVKRSGGKDAALAVALSVSGDAAAQVTNLPQTVTINAGSGTAGFYVRVADNAEVDGDRAVTLAATADGFDDVEKALTIVDDEVPQLEIEVVGVTTNSFSEGTNLVVRVRRPASVSGKALTVYLGGVSTSQFSYPSSVTLAAGEEYAEFAFASVNDSSSELAAALSLRASASGYASAQYDFTLEDDDIPGVSFTLSPEAVSEGAGLNAVYAVLERTDDDVEKLKKAITVFLTASEENALIMPESVTIPANTRSVRFAIGVVDNAEMEAGGGRTVVIDAAIRIDSCGCSWRPQDAGGALSATLAIADNDGPALFVTAEPTTMREGLAEAGVLTIRANSASVAEDVTVTLSHDGASEIAIPATVTIPAGANSVTAAVQTLDDGEEDGSKVVSVYAEATGFAPGSTWVLVTDQNLPDFVVRNIHPSEASIIAGETIEVEFDVMNVGFRNRSGGVPYSVYWVEGTNTWRYAAENIVFTGVTENGVSTNAPLHVVCEVPAPPRAGNGRIAVVADPDGTITELDGVNNSAWSDAVTVSPAYVTTDVACDKAVYGTGEKITVTGVAVRPNGTTPAANVEVEVYILSGGMRRTVSVTTDENGEFAASYTPMSGEAGRFSVGASYPGINAAAVQATCDVAGFALSGLASARYVEDLTLGDVVTNASARIRNPCGIALTGVTAEAVDMPESCGLEVFGIPAGGVLAAGEFINFRCVFSAVNASPGKNYEKFSIRLTSAEGAELTIPVFFYSQAKKAHFESTPASISATMTKGRTRTVSFELTNLGYGEAVDVRVVSPDVDWLRVVGGAETASLTNNQSVTVTLELSPGADIELNRNFSGRLAVNGRNKGEDAEQTFLTVPMTFMAVSEETGGVRVDCVDDATYNLESAPHLAGAHVRITNPYTGAVVAEGDSGADGLFLADGIPEGTYQLVVTAQKHGSYAAAVEVNPGRTARVTAFLQYQAITANWVVTRTEIEDQYQVDLVLDFETSVPVPVVKMDFMDKMPSIQPGESYATKAVFTNLGLIRADKVSFTLPAFYGYVWVYPAGSFSLAAGAARAVPVVLHRLPYSVEGDYDAFRRNPDGGRPSGGDFGAIKEALEDKGHSAPYDDVTLADYIEAEYGGISMVVLQHGKRAGSGTYAPGGSGEHSNANPCEGFLYWDYSYKCDGDRWVVSSKQLVYDDNCPRTDAPGVDIKLGDPDPTGPSRGVEQSVNIPPGMDGGNFWIFEDGCDGGVRSDLPGILKRTAKAARDLGKCFYGGVMPGFTHGSDAADNVDNSDKDPNAWIPILGNLSSACASGEDYYPGDKSDKTPKENVTRLDKGLAMANFAKKSFDGTYKSQLDAAANSSNPEWDTTKTWLGIGRDAAKALPNSAGGNAATPLKNLNTVGRAYDACRSLKADFDKYSRAPANSDGGRVNIYRLQSAPIGPKTLAQTIADETPSYNNESARINVIEACLDATTNIINCAIEYVGGGDEWLNADIDELSEFIDAVQANIDNLSVEVLASAKPQAVSQEALAAFVARMAATRANTPQADDEYAALGKASVVRLAVVDALVDRIAAAEAVARREGYGSVIVGGLKEFVSVCYEILDDMGDEATAGVCAKVSLKLSQKYTMTREAFEGTLTLYNGHDSTAMTNVWLELQITNEAGDNCNGLFEISAKSGGALEANGSNVVNVNDVASKSEGTTIVQFVPAIAAAPETPVAYKFGGKVHYRDPFTGEEAAITLLPVTLEVNPMPQLHLDYFVQRDVYADNPFTKDIVEASMPAELAVLIRNEGYGDAKNVKIESVQPEIVENEKGLMVDFRLSDYSLDAAALNGATAGLGLNDVSLGTVAARKSAVAQWWLTSTLQGHFTGMRASVTHLNSQGIVDTSLIREVAVHPLIRSVDVGDELPAFLTADGSRYGNPDRLYRADGEVLDVRSDATAATGDSVRGAQCTIAVTASIPGSGPFYAKVALPGAEEYEVVGLERNGGAELSVRNAWITDRTFVDGADPKVETFLHLFDSASSAGEKSYTVTLRAKPTDAPEVTGFEGVTADALVTNPVERLVVGFSKAIDPATFTADDITVRWQGVLTNGVVASITPVDDDSSRYELAFERGFAEQEGRFIVQVFSAGVTSLSGTLGKSAGRQVGWTYYVIDKPAVVSIKGWLDGSTVNSVANVTVQFAAAIDPASFTYQAIKVDGQAVDDTVTVTALNKANTSFRVTGLDGAIVLRRGINDHTIEIDTSFVRNASGVAGAAKFTATVTIDENAPTATLSDDGEVFGSRKWTLTFSKPVVASTVSVSAFSLTRDGVAVAMPASARLTQVSDTVWTLSGLDAALGADGAYALSFDASQVRDASGNAGDGTAATSEWSYSSEPPALIDDLAFAPDWGTNATDGVTWQRNVTISGTLTNGAYSVEILVRDAAGGESVLVETFYPEAETSFEKVADLPIGRGTIVVRCANSSGKTSDSEKDFFVDAIPLSFAFAGFPEDGEGPLTNDVALVFSEPVTNVTAECFSIRRGARKTVEIPANALTISPDESNLVWTVSGLDALTASGGTYKVTFDVSRVEKLSSGLHGEMDEESASVSWRYTPPDTTPPELVRILFDGAEMYGVEGGMSVASNGASQVKFVFSEPVNFSSLKSGGWLGRAIRMQLLDVGGSVTGEVALAASQFRWRSGENAIVWTRRERALPVGRVRFLLDAGLLTDTAGNPLVGNSGINSFVHFSKRATLFTADGTFAAPANFGGQLVVGVKKNGAGEAYYYGFDGVKGACVVDGVTASNCLGVSVAQIGGDVYHGTYDGKVYKNGTLLEDVNAGRERAVLSVWNDNLVIGGDDGKLMRLDGSALEDLFGEELVVDSYSPRRSAAAFSGDWTYEGKPILIVGRGRGGLALYVGDGEGRWNGTHPLSLASLASTNLYERTRPVAIDVNGDGLDDLVTGYADGTVDVRYASVNKAFAFEFEALPFHTLEEALDTDELAPELIWKTTAETPWLAQTGEAPYGGDFAISATSAQQESALETVVVGPGTLTFHWKKGGAGGSYCVKTNGVEALSCAALEWGAASVTIGSGFVQVSFVASNGGIGYLDYVTWTPDASASADEQALQAEKAAYDEDFAAFMETYGGINHATATAGDYLRAMATETGKTDANGNSTTLLDEFIAGTDPFDLDDVFYATIAIEEGIVYVGWVPDLNVGGQIRRVYKVYGKERLSDEWSANPLSDAEINGGAYRFFRVTVEMP